MELCLSSYACRFVLVELCFIKMKDSTPMLARFRICEVVRVVLVELCFAKCERQYSDFGSLMICTDCARCAFRVVLAKNERQYSDFGKIYDLHGLCTLCLSSCPPQK